MLETADSRVIEIMKEAGRRGREEARDGGGGRGREGEGGGEGGRGEGKGGREG